MKLYVRVYYEWKKWLLIVNNSLVIVLWEGIVEIIKWRESDLELKGLMVMINIFEDWILFDIVYEVVS